jgi:hypothetical protein
MKNGGMTSIANYDFLEKSPMEIDQDQFIKVLKYGKALL